MGGPLRIERAGGWYHVTGRGNERKAIYRDNRDRFHFVGLVAEMVRRFRVILHGYQLMDNHYHLIVELTEKNYREYVESALREGMPASPWEQLQEQVVLGGSDFLKQLRAHVKGNAREQRGAARLARGRPKLEEVIGAVEQIKGESWSDFRDRYGDGGRDLVLYAGQRVCGMKLRELAAATGMKDYGAAASAIRRFERLLRHGKVEQQQWQQLCQKYNNQM